MIPLGLHPASLPAPDPAAFTLMAELAAAHRRLELAVGHIDPKTCPQGVADGIHDALVALADARQLAEAVSWGWNG